MSEGESSPGTVTASPEETAALAGLKEELSKVKADWPGRQWLMEEAGDLTLLRFLRGHKLNVKKATKLLKNCAKWRTEYGTNDILETWPANNSKEALLVKKFWPMAVTGNDFNGRPVHYFHLSMVDFPHLAKFSSIDHMVRHNVYLFEKAMKANPKGEAIMIVDLGQSDSAKNTFNLKNVHHWIKSVLLFITAMAKIADPYYPETYFRIYFVRLHSVFEKMWKTTSSSMNEATLSKVQLLQKDEMLGSLLEDIPRQSIPPLLGGESPARIPSGGLVSKEDVEAIEKEAAELGGGTPLDKSQRASQRMSLRQSLSKRLSMSSGNK